MGIDARQYPMVAQDVKRAVCVGCGMCAHVCPRRALKMESKAVRFRGEGDNLRHVVTARKVLSLPAGCRPRPPLRGCRR